jgi:hypothetical protein
MKIIYCVIVVISLIFLCGACSLIGISNSATTGTVSSNYPDTVTYKIDLSDETYLCSSFNVISTDALIALRLNDVYVLSSDGKITWIGKEKEISAVKIEKILK